MNWIISMAKNIYQMIIVEIYTDQMSVKNIDPNYLNCVSREKYRLDCLSVKNIIWIFVTEKNADQIEEWRAQNKNLNPF